MKARSMIDHEDTPWLLSLTLVGGVVWAIFMVIILIATAGRGGVPLDDAWIHFQFARNLARGAGLSFNPGQPTSGSTAPLWTLILAAAYRLGASFPEAGQVLSGLAFVLVLLATYGLAKRITGHRWAAWLAATVTALNGRLAWAGVSALETCLFAALSLAAVAAHHDDRLARRYRPGTALLFGLAALCRPEGYLLFGLAMVDFALVLATRCAEPWSERWRRIPLLPALLFVAIVSPYLVFSLRTSGHLLPNTFHAKATVGLSLDRDFLSVAARYLILDNPLLLPFFVLGLSALAGGTGLPVRDRAPLLTLWSAGLPLIYALLHATLYQHGRYLIPLIPFNGIVAVAGLLEARRLAARYGIRWRGDERILGAIVATLVLLATAWRLPTMARLTGRNVEDINRMHVGLGHWVEENTPPEAVLALNDIGAITYVSERQVIDLAGLVTPEVIPQLHAEDRDDRLAALIVEQNADYAILFPNWFPGLAAQEDLLEEIHRVTLADNTIAGGDTMVVYRVLR